LDRYLDAARSGPTWLVCEDIARIVADALEFADTSLGYYKLEAYVVMSNHLHLLVMPRVAPAKFLQSVKGFSARECNKILGRAGEPFWQSESFDHWVRDQAEFERVRTYIENNPVRAGLVVRPQTYRWSSAYAGRNAVAAG
jgi:REP element-mobilizing transposase RayT